MIRAGQLDRRITLQHETESQDATGEPIKTWAAVDTVWAQYVPLRGAELFGAKQLRAEADSKFRIRYRSDVTPENRIVWGGRNWDIVSVSEIGRQEGLDIVAFARAE